MPRAFAFKRRRLSPPPWSGRSVLVTDNTNVKFCFLSGLVCMCSPVLVDAAHM